MSTLAAQQQALLDALFMTARERPANPLEALLVPGGARGLMAYRAHGHALAERVLQAAYPVLAAFIGGENFAMLARALWHAHPPRCGDLALWGDALPEWLGSLESHAHPPCLSDLARVEWALHQATSARDVFIDLPSFERLTQEDPRGLGLRLAPGTAVIASRWPVVSLMQAHREHTPSMTDAGQRLRDGVAECALVWRQGMRPRLSDCTSAEAPWLEALVAGSPLPNALTAVAGTDFNLGDWLPRAVQQGLVLGVVSVPPSTQESP